jgi:hypothetical protein
VEHRNADTVTGRGTSGDDAARFLRELKQLRDGAGLGHAELAARAHFPYDSIRAAEVGPSLPDLPVLSAFVRGCGGTTEEWEERWRSLTRSPSLPLAGSRSAGRSDAATAGARIGSVSQGGDSPDPSVIIAALNRVAEEMASPGDTAAPQAGDFQAAGDFPPAEVAFPPAPEAFSATAFPPAADEFPPPPAGVPAPAGPFPSAPDFFRPAADAFPPSAGEFPPPPAAFPAAPGSMADDKPAGWDPIRVSTAWPAIRDTQAKAAAEPAGSTPSSASTGMGVPWGTAPWAQDPQDAPSRATRPARSAPLASGARPGAAHGPAAGRGSARPASLTKIVVIAAVLLCVLAVLLAVFA